MWERAANPGFALGSMGAFLVLESAAHARARGAKPLARLAGVVRAHPTASPARDGRWTNCGDALARVQRAGAAFISGATGVEPATARNAPSSTTILIWPMRTTGTADRATASSRNSP